jgi:CRP/FNR family transcriptional regulator
MRARETIMVFAREAEAASQFNTPQYKPAVGFFHQPAQPGNGSSACPACTGYPFCSSMVKNREQATTHRRGEVHPAKTVLFTQGEKALGVFVVRQGSVKLSMTSKKGRAVIVRVAHAGDILGLTSLLSGEPCMATAETLEPTELCFLERTQYLEFLSRNPEAALKIAQQASAGYEKACKHIAMLGLCQSVTERVAQFLLSWPGARPNFPGRSTRLRLTHEEIAQMTGTSRETVTRTLIDFKKKGWAQVHSSSLVISDRPALEELAASCDVDLCSENSLHANI